MKGILIGRFQPFHNSHLQVCKQILKECNELIIAISNPENKENVIFENQPNEKTKRVIEELRKKERNPFTFSQRKGMISSSLQAEGVNNFKIVPFYGIYTHGAESFEKSMPAKQNSIIYLPVKDEHQQEFKNLFEQHGWKVKLLDIRDTISATLIREKLKNNEDISNLVPKQVYEMIKNESSPFAGRL